MPDQTIKTPQDYAVEAAEQFDAARSTEEKPRPVSVTSTDEAKAAADLRRFEVEVERPDGHRQVRRVAVPHGEGPVAWAALDDDVIRVDPL